MIIWLASYPKSGNTWLRLFLRSYFLSDEAEFSINQAGNNEFEAKTFPNIDMLKKNKINYFEFEQIVKNWVKIQDYINLNNKVNLLKTHNGNFNINGFPFTNTENTIGGIYIVRDPRDVAISNADHFNISHEEAVLNMSNMQNYEFYDKDLHKGFKISILGTWSSNYNSWKNYQGRHIHLVKYEDMIKKPDDEFYKILEYLSSFIPFKVDRIKIGKAIEDTSFKNLSKMENEKGFLELGGGKKFFRKGIIGDWQNNLDPKLVKTIEENFNKEMKELGYI